MAGKEHSGLENAESRLFANAVWLLVPQPHQTMDKGKIKDYCELLEKMGVRLLKMDADRHDQICAWISHLPQMVSTAIAATLVDELGDNPDVHAVGGRALREMTRIASSPYSMWRDITHTNTGNIEHALARLEPHSRKPAHASSARRIRKSQPL